MSNGFPLRGMGAVVDSRGLSDLSDSSSRGRSAPAISGLLVLLALGILILGAPIIARYATWFRARHSPAAASISVAATVTVLFLLFVGEYSHLLIRSHSFIAVLR